MRVATADIAERMMERVPSGTARRMSPTHKDAFLEAFDDHADALFRHASFRISNRERAADLTQETFLKAWDYVREGKKIEHWKGFLYRVLNNLIIDEYRRAKEVSLDAMLEEDPGGTSVFIATGSRAEKEERLDDELMIEKLRGLIPQLPEDYRTALSLRYFDGFSPKEIASVLGISENVASVRIHRGVAQLKELCGVTKNP